MADDNHPANAGPVEAVPLSIDEAADKLGALFDPPAKKPDQAKAPDAGEEPDEAQDDEPEAHEDRAEPDDQDDDPEAEADADEAEDDDDGEDDDASDDPLAEYDAEVQMPDGSKVPLKELVDAHQNMQERIAGFQRNHVQRMEQVKQAEGQVEQQAQRVTEYAQQLAQERDQFLQLARMLVPPEPQPPQVAWEDDPGAWGEYQASKVRYDHQMAQINQVYGQVAQRSQQHQAEQQQQVQRQIVERLPQERQKLLERFPELKDPARMKQARQDLDEGMQAHYGVSAQEIASIADARAVAVMLDAIAYRKLKAEQPKLKRKVEGKPPVIKPGKRKSLESRRTSARNRKKERLMRTGSMEAAVDVLMDLDL